MKKLFLVVMLIVGITMTGFSQEETDVFRIDTWYSVGHSFGNYFMNGSGLDNGYTGSPGINLNLYALFGENNIGAFFNYGIMFPVINDNEKDYEPSVQLDFILGFGFGYSINEKIMLHLGIGPNMNILFLHSSEDDINYGDYFIGLGLGSDVGLKIKLAKYFSLDVGTTVSYNFAAYREVRSNIDFRKNDYDLDKSGWVNNYSMFGIKPYITLGFNYYN